MDEQTLVIETDHQVNTENMELLTISSPAANGDQRPNESPEVGEQTEAVRQNSPDSEPAEPSTHSSVTSEGELSNDSSDGQGQLPRIDPEIQSIRDVPVEDAFKEKLRGVPELNIAVVGCFNMGKSALINCLFFEKDQKYNKKAKEGSGESCTTREAAKEPYVLEINDVRYNIYDSPGLQDGSDDDLELLQWISQRHDKIHLVIYCTRMEEAIRPAEIEAMKNVNKAFKKSIWNNTVIALTFANKVEPSDPEIDESEYFEKVLKEQVEKLKNIFISELSLQEATLMKIANNIFPVGSARKLDLPGRSQDWRVDFWLGCLDACDPEGKKALFELYKTTHYIDMSAGGVKAALASGIAGIVGGVGCMVAGTALTATVFLAGPGIPLLVGGAVGTGLAIGATVGGGRSLYASKKAMKEETERKKREDKKEKKDRENSRS